MSARRRSRLALGAAALAASLLAASSPVPGHGASRGLHVHVAPEPARPGQTVRVTLDAAARLTDVAAGFANEEPRRQRVDPPSHRAVLELAVPPTDAATLALQVEATSEAGDTLRASAVLRVAPPRGE